MTNLKIFKISLLSLFIVVACGTTTNALETDNADFKFISGIKSYSSKFIQTQYTQDGEEKAEGALNIQKPEKFALDQKTSNMNIRIVSVNKNIKVLDNDTNQITYIDNQYTDLLKFFDEDLKAEGLYYIDLSEKEIDTMLKKINSAFSKNKKDEKKSDEKVEDGKKEDKQDNKKDHKQANKQIKQVCMDFKIGDNNLAGCLVINSTENKLYGLNVYAVQNKKPIGKAMNIVFENQEVNNGVNPSVFVLRDPKVFDENE